MIKSYTARGLLLLAIGLCVAIQLKAETPVYEIKGEEAGIVDGDCHLQRISPTLVKDAVDELTAGLDLAGFWNDSHHLTELLYEIDELQADGLNPEHYRLTLIQQMHTRALNGNTLNGCEIAIISNAYISAINDLHFGRVDPTDKKLFWYADSVQKTPQEAVLLDLVTKGIELGISRAFEKARPLSPAYRGLRDAYQQALAQFPPSWRRIPKGPLLKLGVVDSRIGRIRQRLTEGGYLMSSAGDQRQAWTFSFGLSDAIKKFQYDHSLAVDGVVGPDTIEELNIQPSTRIDQLKVNLERLRWFSQHHEESTLLLVDIAAAKLSYTKENHRRMSAKVMVGMQKRKTPPLMSLITHVTLNPTWTVPPTILKKDILPAVRKDIAYLSEHHMRVFDFSGNELDPEMVDWSNPGSVLLRQDAGPYAALGEVAIRFQNPYQVYLHDTPNKKLFSADKRFFTSGCVRVEHAVTLTELMFEDIPEILSEKFTRSEFSGKPVNVSLPVAIPLLMVYWTAIVDDEGRLRFRPDIYGRDIELLTLLE